MGMLKLLESVQILYNLECFILTTQNVITQEREEINCPAGWLNHLFGHRMWFLGAKRWFAHSYGLHVVQAISFLSPMCCRILVKWTVHNKTITRQAIPRILHAILNHWEYLCNHQECRNIDHDTSFTG